MQACPHFFLTAGGSTHHFPDSWHELRYVQPLHVDDDLCGGVFAVGLGEVLFEVAVGLLDLVLDEVLHGFAEQQRAQVRQGPA